jgi:hypothetical protein
MHNTKLSVANDQFLFHKKIENRKSKISLKRNLVNFRYIRRCIQQIVSIVDIIVIGSLSYQKKKKKKKNETETEN